jgi:hypothetical protein
MTSTNNNNRNNNGSSSNNNQRSNTSIKKEGIQKLSNEKALAEAFLIGKKPCLAVVDFSDSENNNVRIGIMDSLSYSEDTKLVPELLSNRPYSFSSKEEFYTYVEKAKTQTLDSLFDKTLSIWKKYIDADDFHLKICAADTMFTYRQDILGTTHYLFFIADNDAGKSNNLKLLNILAYRNLMNTSMTHANIYNFLGPKEEGVGTICIDEADSIDQYPEIMAILKSGYTKGFPVVRILDSPRRQVKFNTYCFKALAGERLPDEVEATGFMQRTIVIKCFPGFRKDDISEVSDPAGDEEYEDMLNELIDLRNLLFCHRLVHFKDKIPNIKLNIRNREKQLFKPLLRMFQGTRTFDTLRPVISKYINERRESKSNSLHAFLYRIIRDLTTSHKIFELDFSTVWNFVKSNVECNDIPYKPQSIETVEFGVISQKQVGSLLKNVFGGVPPTHTGSSRKLIFSQDVLDRMKDIYETVDVNVDFANSESLDDHTMLEFGTDGTVETDSRGAGTDSSRSDTIENAENNGDNDKNLEEIDTESNNNDGIKDTDIPSHSHNVSQVSQVSQTPEMSANQYQEEVTDSKTLCLNDEDNGGCDLRNQEGADRYRAEVERLCKTRGEEEKVPNPKIVRENQYEQKVFPTDSFRESDTIENAENNGGEEEKEPQK